ncbi:MAG: flagellar hook-length control protein FliK, partial [Acidimicrobiia bacterium]
DDAVPSTATSPTMTPTALSASSPVNGDLMSGGGPGRDHHSAASQLANSASTVSTASTATSTGATSVASTASVASTGAAAASQAQPWEQVLAVLRPTRRFTDGSHRLSIQMTPDDLGTVTIELSMDRGRLSMHMLTETQGAADALRSSLHELRADLEGSGQRTGSFEVAQQWAQHRQNQSEFARAARFSGLDTNAPLGTITAPVGAIDLTTSAGATSDGRLDVRI